jgi:cell fate regulator YaaT (PSP1 superfamily)
VSAEEEQQRRRRRRRRGGGGGGGDRPAQAQQERPPQPQRDRPPQREPERQRQPQPQRERQPQREPQRTPAPIAVLDDEHDVPEARFVPEPEDDRPAPAIELGADLPAERPGDLDPLTAPLLDEPDDGAAALIDPVASWVGVRFASAGKIFPFESGEQRFDRGDRVVVEAEGRGTRLGTVAVATLRRPVQGDRKLPRVLRKAGAHELRAEAAAEEQGRAALLTAKEKARVLDLPIKVFRVETQPGRRLLVYFTSDDRIDLRDFLREVGAATGARIELRQIGARDEAKIIGGIGSCGQELCCTTWLPEMVPVSIKMAKDQGLVLNPTKVSGQCGRLKCCLVYEQATYAEMRKGLPKLGKRVITPHGEGRVVEVDVLRQRIRVTTGPGEFHVLAAGEVTPMFPSQQRAPSEPDPADEPDEPEPAP